MANTRVHSAPALSSRQAASPVLPAKRPSAGRPARATRNLRVHSMAQPVFDTANTVQAALPTVLKILPTAITAGVAIYAGANWLSYSRLRRVIAEKQREALSDSKTRKSKLERLGLGISAKEPAKEDQADLNKDM